MKMTAKLSKLYHIRDALIIAERDVDREVMRDMKKMYESTEGIFWPCGIRLSLGATTHINRIAGMMLGRDLREVQGKILDEEERILDKYMNKHPITIAEPCQAGIYDYDDPETKATFD